MIKCPSCQTPNPENTLFCEECGLYLAKKEIKGTDPLAREENSWLNPEQEAWPAQETGSQAPVILKFTILDSGRRLTLPLKKEINLGRLDPASTTFPDIDLTPNGGLERGVSRRHARISYKEGEVVIEDLGSVNGTFVNNKRLTPYLPHPLKSGDELQLGKSLIKIEF